VKYFSVVSYGKARGFSKDARKNALRFSVASYGKIRGFSKGSVGGIGQCIKVIYSFSMLNKTTSLHPFISSGKLL